jgi:hypothetical protein
MRTIAVCDSPVLLAISQLLQCVLFSGIVSSVVVMTSSTCASVSTAEHPAAAHRAVPPADSRESVPAIYTRSRQ